jgi:two-component system, NarL family, sensor histidine kinase UhpB
LYNYLKQVKMFPTDINHLNILVIEDNPLDFFLLKEFIGMTELPVQNIFNTETLEESKAVLSNTSPSLIFLDLHLPDSMGLETFSAIEKLVPSIPIIILSGMKDTSVSLQAIALGAQDYLVKGDFDNKLLFKTIQYSIERKRNEEHLRLVNERYELIAKATSDIVWEWDLVRDEKYWMGNNFQHFFGHPLVNSITPPGFWENLIHPDDAAMVKQRLYNVLVKDQHETFQCEYRLRKADGSYAYIYDRGFVIYHSSKKPLKMVGAMMDITERKKLERELSEQQLLLQKQLTENTIQTQERERAELGKELHDNINQILATAKLFTEMAISEGGMRDEFLRRSYSHIVNAISEIRKLSHELIPPSLGDIGLNDALQEMVNSLNSAQRIKIHLKTEGLRKAELSENKKLMVFRIVQEQLNNILKHSKASNVEVELNTAQNFLYVTIKDNGIGFDPAKKTNGIGLRNIGNRVEVYNGQMKIKSAPGKGCELRIVIPLTN